LDGPNSGANVVIGFGCYHVLADRGREDEVGRPDRTRRLTTVSRREALRVHASPTAKLARLRSATPTGESRRGAVRSYCRPRLLPRRVIVLRGAGLGCDATLGLRRTPIGLSMPPGRCSSTQVDIRDHYRASISRRCGCVDAGPLTRCGLAHEREDIDGTLAARACGPAERPQQPGRALDVLRHHLRSVRSPRPAVRVTCQQSPQAPDADRPPQALGAGCRFSVPHGAVQASSSAASVAARRSTAGSPSVLAASRA
jgi:hypothetical protein